MACNKVVRFLVNNEQFTRLKALSSRKGYVSLSAYLRDVSLGKYPAQEEMIVKIYQKVIQDGRI